MMAGAAPHADPSVMHRNLRRCLVPLAAAAIAG
jgi:hypothetical protein